MTRSLLLKTVQAYARHFPIQRGKQRVVRLASRLFFSNVSPQETTLVSGGVKMICDPRFYIQQQLLFFGNYEASETRTWLEMSENASVVFDVGANVGLYSLLAASQSSSALIHAFEPTPSLSKRFSANIELNGFTNIINNQVAVGDTGSNMYLNYCTGVNGINEGMNFTTKETSCLEGEIVSSVTIDGYCSENGISKIDIMKIDVEGSEYLVLSGAQALLSTGQIGCILLEALDWASARHYRTAADILSLLRSFDYQICRVLNGAISPIPPNDEDFNGNVLAFAPKL